MNRQQALATEMCALGTLLYERGFIAATEGNFSARLAGQQILCTPSGACKGSMTVDELAVIDEQGAAIRGGHASSEIRMHLQIYVNAPDTAAVVHCHPPFATAYAISQAAVPSGILSEVELFLQDIAVVEYFLPGTQQLAEAVGAYATTHCAALLKNHGAVTWGTTLLQARYRMEMLESYCRALILAQPLGLAQLNSAQIAELREAGQVYRNEPNP